MLKKYALSALFLAIGATQSMAAEKEAELLTLEWPPYTSASLPDGGATTAIVRKALEASGYQVKVTYLPWKRAVDTVAGAQGKTIAFFPGYHCKQAPGLIGSEAIGESPVGFAQNKDAPIAWSGLDDLKGKHIGTVMGYSNTPEFDAMVSSGQIKADVAPEDVANLKKLVAKRIDGAVIDKYVLEYLKKKDAGLAATGQALEFNAKPLQNNVLHVCAHDDAAGKELVDAIDKGLKSLDITKMTTDYYQRAM